MILWLHSSTPDKNQILTPSTNGGDEPLGECFVRAGYIVMAPDAYWYGDRADLTPAGPAEAYRIGVRETNLLSEYSLAKFNLWFGRTLWGMFVRDDQIALDYLCNRPEVDTTCIGVTGMSMGSTCVVAGCGRPTDCRHGGRCLPDALPEPNRAWRAPRHGPYYFVYGLLKHFDTEGVVASGAVPFWRSPAIWTTVRRPTESGRLRTAPAASSGLSGPPTTSRASSTRIPDTSTRPRCAEMLAWFARWLKPSAKD